MSFVKHGQGKSLGLVHPSIQPPKVADKQPEPEKQPIKSGSKLDGIKTGS